MKPQKAATTIPKMSPSSNRSGQLGVGMVKPGEEVEGEVDEVEANQAERTGNHDGLEEVPGPGFPASGVAPLVKRDHQVQGIAKKPANDCRHADFESNGRHCEG